MQFITEQTLNTPQRDLFTKLTDFGKFESFAAGKGVQFHRVSGDIAQPQNGMSWDVEFMLSSKMRKLTTTLDKIDAPDVIAYQFESANIQGKMAFELTPLSQEQTSLLVTLDIEARSLAARLMLQSVKLARTKANQKFEGGIQKFIGLIGAA